MGLACVRKPEGLVSLKARSKARPETRFQSVIQIGATHKCDQIGTTHKCDQQVRLTSAIDRCDSQVRLTGATHKCDRLNHESKSLQVCKFASLKKLKSLQVRKFALKKHKKSKKLF